MHCRVWLRVIFVWPPRRSYNRHVHRFTMLSLLPRWGAHRFLAYSTAFPKALRESRFFSTSYAVPSQGTAESRPKREASKTKASKKVDVPKKKKKDQPWERRDENTGELLPLPYDRKPTRRSRFVIYLMERLQELKNKPEFRKTGRNGNSVLDMIAVSSAIGSEWKNLPESERQRIDQLHAKHVAQYEKDLEAWKHSLTPDDIRRQNQFLNYQRKNGKKAVPRNISAPDEPKRPMSAFFLFAQDLRASIDTSSMSVTDFARQAGAQWKSLSAAEKEPFESRARAEKEEYQRRIEQYKASSSM